MLLLDHEGLVGAPRHAEEGLSVCNAGKAVPCLFGFQTLPTSRPERGYCAVSSTLGGSGEHNIRAPNVVFAMTKPGPV